MTKNINVLYYPPSGPDKYPMYRDIIILIATRWLFRKTVFHFHAGGLSTIYQYLNRVEKFFFRVAYFYADAAIVMSEYLSDNARFFHSKKIFIIPNGIEDCFSEPLQIMKKKNEIPTILFAGLLRETKGELILVEASNVLKKKNIHFKVNIVGRFESLEAERKFIELLKKYKLEENVFYRGVLAGDKKNEIFSQADILCFPTFFESEAFPVVLIEAMSFGLPVVSTKWRGIPDIVVDGETGFLINIKDEKAVADKLENLIADENLRKQMGTYGRKRYLENYTEAIYRTNFDKCFTEITND